MIVIADAPDEPTRKPEQEIPEPKPEKQPADPQNIPPPSPDVIFPGSEPMGIPTGPGPEIPVIPTPPEM